MLYVTIMEEMVYAFNKGARAGIFFSRLHVIHRVLVINSCQTVQSLIDSSLRENEPLIAIYSLSTVFIYWENNLLTI
jgi:hypothetical protein